jgi:translation initiation factor IF-1
MPPAAVESVAMEGLIKAVLPGGRYRVEVKDGHWLMAERAKKLGSARIVLGDKVTVAVAVYDPTRGIIVQRAETEPTAKAR